MNLVELTDREIATFGLADGDLLFGRRSVVEAGAGRCALVVRPDSALAFESSIIRVRPRQDAIVPRFLYYFFRSPEGRARMRDIVEGTNVKGIRGTQLRDLPIPLPPLPEQRAIAEALGDVDALIDSLDRLIAKKRDLKQGTMQQLLTGKTRLPGFSGEWMRMQLGELVDIIHGYGFSSEYFTPNGTYRLATPGHFFEEGGFRDIGAKQKFYDGPIPPGYVLAPDDLIVAMTEQADGLLGSAALVPPRGTYLHNQRLGKVVPRSPNDADLRFVALLFNSSSYRARVRESAAGTKVKHTSPQKLMSIEVEVPSSTEQTAVANVLSDMDADIDALEGRLSKTRLLKQGMMQELLTGKTRLV